MHRSSSVVELFYQLAPAREAISGVIVQIARL